jgi:hypothetical protein
VEEINLGLRGEIILWADPWLYLCLMLSLFIFSFVWPYRADPVTGRSTDFDKMNRFDRLVCTNVFMCFLIGVYLTYAISHTDIDIPEYWLTRAKYWWPFELVAFVGGFVVKYYYLRYFIPWLSSKRKSLRKSQPTETVSDIRKEFGRFKTEKYNPAKYDKPGHVFVGRDLNAEGKPPVHISLDTWLENHADIIAKTGYGKTSLATTILRQMVNFGFFTFVYDPEKDDNLRDCLYSLAKANDRPFSYVDFNEWGDDGWRPTWGPLIGGSPISRFNRASILCGVEGDGGAGGAEFHHENAKSLLLEACNNGCRSMSSFEDYFTNRIPENDERYASRQKVLAVMGRYNSMPQFKTSKGFSIDTAIAENHVVYVRSSTLIDSYVRAGKIMLIELIEALERSNRKKTRNTHAFVYFDGAKHVISKELAVFLENARKEKVTIMTAHQDAFDMMSVPDPRIKGDALHRTFTVNTSIKFIHCQEEALSRQWAAEQSGEKNQQITRSEHTTVNVLGGEEYEQGRTMGTTSNPLFEPNLFHKAIMPKNVAMMTSPMMMPVMIQTRWFEAPLKWEHKKREEVA